MTQLQKFDEIYESYLNGQKQQAKEQFNSMRLSDRKEFLKNEVAHLYSQQDKRRLDVILFLIDCI